MTGSTYTLTSFRLDGCREMWEKMEKPDRILKIIEVIERSVIDNPSLSFDASKGLLESVCKTILQKASPGFDSTLDLPKLLRATLREVKMSPDDYDGHEEIEPILRRVASGLITTVTAIGELRSKEGLISHGSVGYSRQLDTNQAIFVARSVETVVQMLYMSFLEYTPPYKAITFESNEPFNTYLDNAVAFRDTDEGRLELYIPESDIIVGQFRKSALIYSSEKVTYEALMGEYNAIDADGDIQ